MQVAAGVAGRFAEDTGADIRQGGNAAAFIPSLDRIVMPLFGAFRTPEGFYATLLHEIGMAIPPGSTETSRGGLAPVPTLPRS